jgi:hypothetical protein
MTHRQKTGHNGPYFGMAAAVVHQATEWTHEAAMGQKHALYDPATGTTWKSDGNGATGTDMEGGRDMCACGGGKLHSWRSMANGTRVSQPGTSVLTYDLGR